MSILKKSTFAALLLMLLTTLFSCELNSEDGRWDPMKWTSNRPGDPRKITATAEGGTYQLKCTNYGGPWISSVTDADTVIYAGSKEQDFRHIKYDWYNVLAKENTFYITLPQYNWQRTQTIHRCDSWRRLRSCRSNTEIDAIYS